MSDVSLRESVIEARNEDITALVQAIEMHEVRGGTLHDLLSNTLRRAELRGQMLEIERSKAMTERDGILIGGSDFELQRVLPLAKALLESGMDIDTLLARMMGLE